MALGLNLKKYAKVKSAYLSFLETNVCSTAERILFESYKIYLDDDLDVKKKIQDIKSKSTESSTHKRERMQISGKKGNNYEISPTENISHFKYESLMPYVKKKFENLERELSAQSTEEQCDIYLNKMHELCDEIKTHIQYLKKQKEKKEAENYLKQRKKRFIKNHKDHVSTIIMIQAKENRKKYIEKANEKLSNYLSELDSYSDLDKLDSIEEEIIDFECKLTINSIIKKTTLGESEKTLRKLIKQVKSKLENKKEKIRHTIFADIIAQLKNIHIKDLVNFEEYTKNIYDLFKENCPFYADEKHSDKHYQQVELIIIEEFNRFMPDDFIIEIPMSIIEQKNIILLPVIDITKFSFPYYGFTFNYKIKPSIKEKFNFSTSNEKTRVKIDTYHQTFEFCDISILKDIHHIDNSEDVNKIKIPWDNITFWNGKIAILIPNTKIRIFYNTDCRASFNKIKSYIKSVLPDIYVFRNRQGDYQLYKPIKIENAIKIIKRDSKDVDDLYKRIDSEYRTWLNRPTFDGALKFSNNASYQEYILKRLRNRKQEHIEALIKRQHPDYRLIPARESMAFESSESISEEEAFIFTLKTNYADKVLLVYENLNEARASIICAVRVANYMDCVRALYNHLGDNNIKNKREKLHRNPRRLCNGMYSIDMVAHTDPIYEWSRRIKY